MTVNAPAFVLVALSLQGEEIRQPEQMYYENAKI
jgi:hypothetical protein